MTYKSTSLFMIILPKGTGFKISRGL